MVQFSRKPLASSRAVLVACLICLRIADSARQPPHIIFIVVDDLGWNDVGWHNPDVLTPNLDRLARAGVTLDAAYVQPSCTPSRNSFMSGMFPYHTELQDVIDPSEPMYLPLKYQLLPQRLKQLGYDTHMVGKWHLGFCNEKYTPTHRGFDSFFGFYGGSECHYYHNKADKVVRRLSSTASLAGLGSSLLKSVVRMSAVGYEVGKDFRFNDTVWRESEGEYSTYAFTKRAVTIIERQKEDVPLFLYLPFQAVHSPIEVPAHFVKLYSHIHSTTRKKYLGMVSALDEAIGNITDALRQKGFMDNLLIVFTSDNGGSPYMGGNNMPLRGGKNTMWEGGTRVPTFVYSDTLLRHRRRVSHEIIHAADWLPTFVELARGKKDHRLDGRSQWAMMSRGQRSARSEFVYNIEPSGKGAIRVGDYKLIVGKPGMYNDWYPVPGTNQIYRNRFKGGRFDQVHLRPDPYLLYNIKEDPEERNDLTYFEPVVFHALLNRFRALNATKVPPYRAESDAGADPNNYGGFWGPGWC